MPAPAARLEHGVDLVDVEHLRGVLERHPGLAERVFTDEERAYCATRPDPAPHFAARFAAKEAALKALGIGITPLGVDGNLKCVEVVREGTRPVLRLSGAPARRAASLGVRSQALSLSHDGGLALASVVLWCGGEAP